MEYTTAQMLERLGLKDIATNQHGYKVGFDDDGHLLMWNLDQEDTTGQQGCRYEINHPEYRTDRWTIDYAFLSFTEALTIHLQEKKPIIYWHCEERQYEFGFEEYGNFTQLSNDGYGMTELAEGKWLVKYW